MSARYGRNQKRKAQAALAAKDREIDRLTSVATDHYDRMVAANRARQDVELDLIDWAARIADLLGSDSAFAREIETKPVDERLFQAVVRGGRLRVEARNYNSLAPSAKVIRDIASEVIDTFAVLAGMDYDAIRYRRRYAIESPAGGLALMMDDRTLADMRKHGDDTLARYLLQQLVRPWMQGAKS